MVKSIVMGQSTNISKIADRLWRELLRSHLNVAAVGVIMMVIGAAGAFGLRYYATMLATINTPIALSASQLQAGVQKSVASLYGWMSVENPLFTEHRSKIWNDEIYPEIKRLKKLKEGNLQDQQSLKVLETELYNLDMWQWLIEDVAQTPGNLPANALLVQTITPIKNVLSDAISAMIDRAITYSDGDSLKTLLNIRSTFELADKHLVYFIERGTLFDKNHFSELLANVEHTIQNLSVKNQINELDKDERLLLLKSEFSVYQSLTQEAINLRGGDDWNVSRHLLATVVLPLEQKISSKLNAISIYEQVKVTKTVAVVNSISWWMPVTTVLLFLLMLYVSYRMAKKKSQIFIQPVIELESTKDELTETLNKSIKLNSSLNRNKRRTQIIVESSPVSIITISEKGLIQSFNTAAVCTFGYSKLEMMNQNISKLVPTHLAQEHTDYVGDTKFFGKGQETFALHKDSTKLHIHLSVTQMNLQDETLFLVMLIDLSDEVARRQRISEINEELQANSEELQAQQEELRATNEVLITKSEALEFARKQAEKKSKELEEASRYKSEFLANMSHELRTPLNSLLILSNALAENDEGHLSEDEVESATVIEESGKHLLGLINEILDLSKVEAGKMSIENRRINLSELSATLTSRFKHMAEAKDIGFLINIDDSVPTEFISDEKKLGQILTNLISNAIKFTHRGAVSLIVSAIESKEILTGCSTVLAFSVRDSGVGIAKEKHTAIFETFQQADGSTSRHYGGTGLGLSIVSTFTELLQGKVELESELGKGSLFALYLPVDSADVASQEKSSLQILQKALVFSGKNSPPPFEDDRAHLEQDKPLFLIIEDDADFAKIIFETCHQQYAQAIVAPDGETGINLAKKYDFTGIILDYMLPGIDGKGVMSILKSDSTTQHIPVHIISALDDLIDTQSFGVIGQLTKPASKSDISAVIEQLKSAYSLRSIHLLLVDEDKANVKAIRKLIEKDPVTISCVESGKAAISMLKEQHFSAIILDLDLPDMTGFDLLERLKKENPSKLPPVIVHTSKDLSDAEIKKLHEVTETIIVKSASSPERLQDEVHLFINSINTSKSSDLIEAAPVNEDSFTGKVALLVDDDMRNTFALAKVLRKKQFTVHIATSGKDALSWLEKKSDIDIVLMDIMMPEMDGYETIKRIRQQEIFVKLPIIALTAKAMEGDREKCLETGANDYLTKPVDLQKLLVMMQIWL